MIILENFNKSYGKLDVLKNVNISFSKGEIIGVVGANGAGKTTLFNCITGLESYSGKVDYAGDLKNIIGYLPAETYFLSMITGYEYINLFLQARQIKITDIDAKNIFDLPLKQYASNYSTGMKKKLALTAILLLKNEVFILDEPFSGVDIQSNILIKSILLKLKELNKTVIISSHVFSTLNEICNTIHYLKDGKIEKSVNKDEFHLIEADMKGLTIEGRLEKLF